jgi:hypothetical protein
MKKREPRRDNNVKALRLNKETIRLLEEGPVLENVGGALSRSLCGTTDGCCQIW